MSDASSDVNLIRRLEQDGQAALAELYSDERERLRYMVKLRMNRRLAGRVSPSDILQEAFLDASRRLDEYLKRPDMPFRLWLRFLTGQRLLAIHRRHLGAQMRDAAQDITIFNGTPQATSECIAAHLLGRLTSPSQAVVREEVRGRLQEALNQMEPIDREILTLRHFEELSNNEVAILLNLRKSAASNRYIRALRRLKKILSDLSGFES